MCPRFPFGAGPVGENPPTLGKKINKNKIWFLTHFDVEKDQRDLRFGKGEQEGIGAHSGQSWPQLWEQPRLRLGESLEPP